MTYRSKSFAVFLGLKQNFTLHTNCLAWFLLLFSVMPICNNIASAQSILTTINVGPEAGNGLVPFDIAINQNLNKVYVVNQSTNNVSVIDGSTNLVEATIGLEEDQLLSFDFIEVNSTTNMIYVAGTSISFTRPEDGELNNKNFVQGTINITVIDGITNKIVKTISIDNTFVTGLAVNPNTNQVYVAGNSISHGIIGVINGENNQLADIVSLKENIFVYDIAVNSKSNTAYTIGNRGNSDNNIIKVVDGKDNCISDTIIIRDANFQDIDVNPTTNMIYLTDSSRNEVSVINGANNRVTHRIEIIDMLLDDIKVDSSTNTIYVIGQPTHSLTKESHISIIDGLRGRVTETIEILTGKLYQIAVNPNSSMIYATEPFLDKVHVIDAINNQVVNIIDTGFMLGELAVNPNTNRIYVVNLHTNSLSIIDSLTNEVIDNVTFSLSDTHLERIVINPSTNIIYVAGDSRSSDFNGSIIHVIDGSSNQIIDKIMLRNIDLLSLAVNPNTNTIYAGGVTNTRSRLKSVIRVINGSRNKVTNSILTRGIESPIVVNSNTNTIYFASSNQKGLTANKRGE